MTLDANRPRISVLQPPTFLLEKYHNTTNKKQARQATERAIIVFTMVRFEWWPENHAETVRSMNAQVETYADLFLPSEFIRESVLPTVATTFAALCLVYFAAYLFIADYLIDGNDSKYHFKKRKICDQFTNLLTNAVLGFSGLLCEFEMQKEDTTTQETVTGHHTLVYFSAWQLGYQLWAIPVGLLFVRESLPMLVHHFTVIMVAAMSGFLQNGFRYWTPFFYGLIELSSVPLAVMNAFKENKHLIERYPVHYARVRAVFAFSFVYLRIVMFVPRHYMYLRDQMLLWTDSHLFWYKVFMAACWISSAVLLFLQLFWASIIVKGMLTLQPTSLKKAS